MSAVYASNGKWPRGVLHRALTAGIQVPEQLWAGQPVTQRLQKVALVLGGEAGASLLKSRAIRI